MTFLLALFLEIWLTLRFELLEVSSVILWGRTNAAVCRGVACMRCPFSAFLNICIDEILVASPDFDALDRSVLRDCLETLDTNVSSSPFDCESSLSILAMLEILEFSMVLDCFCCGFTSRS